MYKVRTLFILKENFTYNAKNGRLQGCIGRNIVKMSSSFNSTICACSCFATIFNQQAFTWSKLTIETLEQGIKYVQSQQ